MLGRCADCICSVKCFRFFAAVELGAVVRDIFAQICDGVDAMPPAAKAAAHDCLGRLHVRQPVGHILRKAVLINGLEVLWYQTAEHPLSELTETAPSLTAALAFTAAPLAAGPLAEAPALVDAFAAFEALPRTLNWSRLCKMSRLLDGRAAGLGGRRDEAPIGPLRVARGCASGSSSSLPTSSEAGIAARVLADYIQCAVYRKVQAIHSAATPVRTCPTATNDVPKT